MGVFRDEKRIAELLEQIAEIDTPVSGDLEERMISALEEILKEKQKPDSAVYFEEN